MENSNQETFEVIQRLLIKTTEILSLMKEGKIIVAYEKLGGVAKTLNSFGMKVQSCLTVETKTVPADVS